MIRLELPYPPSINHYYVNAGKNKKRVKSRKVQDYFDAAVWGIKQQKVATFGDSPVRVTVGIQPPDRRRRDMGNLDKAIMDVMEEAGVYDDDFQASDVRYIRLEPVNQGIVHVKIERCEHLWHPLEWLEGAPL